MSAHPAIRARRGPAPVAVSGILWTAVGFAVVAALLVAHAAGRIGVVEQGLELSKLQAQEQSLGRENARLHLEVLTLRSPARLERLASGKLGMAPPDPASILRPPAQAPLPRRAGGALAERP